MSAVLNIIAYIYGRGTAEKLKGRRVEVEYNKAGRVRRVFVDGRLAFVLRNNDGYLLPTLYGASFLENRVVVRGEAAEYVAGGRNVPAKYIADVSSGSRANGEVAVVDAEGRLIAVGRLVYSSRELSLGRGYAVRVREALKDVTGKEPREPPR